MGATTLTHVTTTDTNNNTNLHGPVVEEVEGLIKVYEDGYVERPDHLLPSVGPSLPIDLGVTCSEVDIDKSTNVWARLYVPTMTTTKSSKLPLIVYFHGGGFCVGTPSWLCYHEFLSRLSARSGCLVMSVDYRLAPENPLPAAYEDGVNTILWLNKSRNDNLWEKLDFGKIYLAGDSAGGNTAHQVAARLASKNDLEVKIKGLILIQPYYGGEARTESEKRVGNNKDAVLTLDVSDTWWKLALPRGSNREHPYCKPVKIEEEESKGVRIMMCVAEMDFLKDRNIEMCDENEKVIKRVVYEGVGHAFHILGTSEIDYTKTLEMMCHIDAFINHYDSFN